MVNQLNSLGVFSSPYQQSSGWIIACLVIALHLSLLGIGHFWNSTPPPLKARAKVVVQTIRLAPPSASTIVQTQSPPTEQPLLAANLEHLPSIPVLEESTKKEEPAKKAETPAKQFVHPKTESKPTPKPATPEVKKVTPAKPAEKKQASAPTKPKTDLKAQESEKKKQEKAEAEKKRQQEVAAAEEAARQRQQALLTKAKENLAKMNETRDKISQSTASSVKLATTPLPKEVNHLQVDALPLGERGSTAQAGEWGVKEISYRDEIVYRVKAALKFPDYGTVKIKLTLDRTGKVLKVETTQSESAKNKAYLERTLPTLQFPAFGQQFSGATQYTFLMTLHNDS